MAMVPHTPAIDDQEPFEWFFLVEKLKFDIAVMTGFKDELEGEPEGAVLSNNNTTWKDCSSHPQFKIEN